MFVVNVLQGFPENYLIRRMRTPGGLKRSDCDEVADLCLPCSAQFCLLTRELRTGLYDR